MKRDLLLKRLQSLKDNGLEVIFSTDDEYLNIDPKKLLSKDNIIIKKSNSLDEIEKMIEKSEDDYEIKNSSSLFDFFKSNLK